MTEATDQSTRFGARVARPVAADDSLYGPGAPQSVLSTPDLTPVPSHEILPRAPVPPHSPFYQHPPSSFERVHSRDDSKHKVAMRVTEKDIEAQSLAATLSSHADDNPFTSKISVDCNKECRMWPSRQTLMQTKRDDRNKRRARQFLGGCVPLRQKWETYTKKQKLLIQFAVALLVIGIMVAIGVGISKAVNGNVYAGPDGSHPIGQDS